MENDYQLAINRLGRATTGIFWFTPLGIVMTKSKLTTAKPLLDCRQAKFMQRLMVRLKATRDPRRSWRGDDPNSLNNLGRIPS